MHFGDMDWSLSHDSIAVLDDGLSFISSMSFTIIWVDFNDWVIACSPWCSMGLGQAIRKLVLVVDELEVDAASYMELHVWTWLDHGCNSHSKYIIDGWIREKVNNDVCLTWVDWL